jgi:hypothetical protein
MLHKAGCLLFALLAAAHAAMADVRPFVSTPARCPAVPFLIICPQKAVNVVEPLARLHQQQGLVCRIVSTESIYAWAGRADPAAITKFLRQLPREKMKFVLLIGCGDTKAELLLPATMAPANYVHPTLPCDDFFYSDLPYAQRTDDSPPDLAVGRLPARDLGELRTMVAHAVAASAGEKGPWQRKVEVAAGRAEVSPSMDGLLDIALEQLIDERRPAGLELRVFSGQSESAQPIDPRKVFLERLNAAPAMFVYIGHGRRDALGRLSGQSGQEPIFSVADCPSLALPRPRTLLLAIACQSGDFAAKGNLCESLLAAPDGPGGCIAASGISQPYGNAVLATLLSEALADPPPTAGALLLQLRKGLWTCTDSGSSLLDLPATAMLGSAGMKAQIRDTAVMYNLLGDPAMPLGCGGKPPSEMNNSSPLTKSVVVQPAPARQEKLKQPGKFD